MNGKGLGVPPNDQHNRTNCRQAVGSEPAKPAALMDWLGRGWPLESWRFCMTTGRRPNSKDLRVERKSAQLYLWAWFMLDMSLNIAERMTFPGHQQFLDSGHRI